MYNTNPLEAETTGEKAGDRRDQASNRERAEDRRDQASDREKAEDRRDQASVRRKTLRRCAAFAGVALLLCLLFFAAINIGSLKVSFPVILRGLFVAYNDKVATIYDLRFPRILISILAGMATAAAGVLFQAVLKNPLADPGIIGISSGASLAAALITALAPSLLFFTPLFAALGGLLAFFLVYSLSWRSSASPLRIILVGIAVNAMFSGLLSAFSSGGGSYSGVSAIANGNITMKTWDDVKTLAPYTAAGLILALGVSGRCNLLSLSERTAGSLGVHVGRTRIFVSLIAVVLASISTAVAGAISFLGLIVPHIGRLLVGSDHKVLLPFSMLLGGFTFLLADTIGRSIAAPNEISAAVIMSVIGGPFFILLLRRSRSYAA